MTSLCSNPPERLPMSEQNTCKINVLQSSMTVFLHPFSHKQYYNPFHHSTYNELRDTVANCKHLHVDPENRPVWRPVNDTPQIDNYRSEKPVGNK
jgi:hypothetical protein